MIPIFINADDPTRTITLRKRFTADMVRRFKKLMRDIRTSVVDNDVFGLKDREVTALAAAPARAFSFVRDPQKVEGFMTWLREQEEQGILEVTARPGGTVTGEPWINTYIRSSYQRGMESARTKAISGGAPVLPFSEQLGGLVSAFNRPFHAERAALVYTRAFNDLKGITEAMNQQISRILAQGIAQGDGVQTIARKLNGRVDKIGISRARTLVRTEIVQSHNEGVINEHIRLEAEIGEPIYDKWVTARDERVRSSHAIRHGKIFRHEEALALIGEPNCRCTLVPYIESVHGQIEKKERRRARAIVKKKEAA